MADVTNTFYTSDASIGYGAQLLIGQDNGSPETFAAISQVARIKIGDITTGIINKTHLRSPGRTHEKIATIGDIGPFEISGQLNMKHGSQNNAGGDGFINGGLIALARTKEERNMKVVMADESPATEIEFRGVISSLSLGELTLEGIQEFTAQVQPLADWTAGLP